MNYFWFHASLCQHCVFLQPRLEVVGDTGAGCQELSSQKFNKTFDVQTGCQAVCCDVLMFKVHVIIYKSHICNCLYIHILDVLYIRSKLECYMYSMYTYVYIYIHTYIYIIMHK